jgi:hypothetical protein
MYAALHLCAFAIVHVSLAPWWTLLDVDLAQLLSALLPDSCAADSAVPSPPPSVAVPWPDAPPWSPAHHESVLALCFASTHETLFLAGASSTIPPVAVGQEHPVLALMPSTITPYTQLRVWQELRRIVLGESRLASIQPTMDMPARQAFLDYWTQQVPAVLVQPIVSPGLEELAEAPAVAELRAWLRASAADHAALDKVRVLDVPGRGRGVMAVRDIAAGEDIMVIPRCMLLNKFQSRAATGTIGEALRSLGDDADDELLLLLHTFHEWFVNPASVWKPYFDSLPDLHELPLLWPASRLADFEGTPLLDEIIRSREGMQEILEGPVKALSTAFPQAFPADACTLDRFLQVRGRSFEDARTHSLLRRRELCLIHAPWR